MDEAERCHKLAILEDGVKRADGAPEQLMNNIAAHVVEIEADGLRHLKQKLLKLPDIVTAAQLGARLRVLIKNTVNDPIGFLQHHTILKPNNLSIVRPSLEDVFITCTGSGR
jgi:ABC-2 type transport system ATP-binding protein